jgi:hypothetical protein
MSGALAVINCRQDLQIQDHKTPELVDLGIHACFILLGNFHIASIRKGLT